METGQLSPGELQQVSTAPAGQLSPDELKQTSFDAAPAGDVFKDGTAQEIQDFAKANPHSVDLSSLVAQRPDLQDDPKALQNISDAYYKLNDTPWYSSFVQHPFRKMWEGIKTVGTLGKGAISQVGNLDSAFADAVGIGGAELSKGLGKATGIPEQVDAANKKQDALWTDFQSRLAATGAAADTDLGAIGKMIETAGRNVPYLNKSRKDFTDQDKVEDFLRSVEHAKQIQNAVQVNGPLMQTIGNNVVADLRSKGALPTPETVQTQAQFDPFSMGLFEAGMAGAGKVIPTPVKAAIAAGTQKAGQVLAQAAPVITKPAGLAAQGAGLLLKKAPETAESVGTAIGAHTLGTPGALVGEHVGKLVGKGLTGISETAGETLQDYGKLIRQQGSQTVRDILESAPAAALPVVAGGAFDIGTQALGAETPTEKENVTPIGTALGIIGAGKIIGKRVLSGQIVGPRDWGSDIAVPTTRNFPDLGAVHAQAMQDASPGVQRRVNAVRQFVQGIDPNAEVFYTGGSADTPAALKATGIPEGHANSNGFRTTAIGADGERHTVIVLQNIDAGPHEGVHAMDNVIGSAGVQELNAAAKQQYAPVWDQITNRYAGMFSDFDPSKQTAAEFLLDKTGAGNDFAREKLINDLVSQGRPADTSAPVTDKEVSAASKQVLSSPVDWRNVLTPEEQSHVVDQIIGNEVRAENGDAWFKAGGDSTTLRGKMARMAGNVVSMLGGNPLEGRVSEGQKLPLSPEVIQGVSGARASLGRGEAPVIRPSLPKVTAAQGTPQNAKQQEDRNNSIAASAPDITLPGAAKSQQEMMGVLNEARTSGTPVDIQYGHAGGTAPAAGADLEPEEMANTIFGKVNRPERRAFIEAWRKLPIATRTFASKLFSPSKFEVTKQGKYQVYGTTHAVFAANAQKLADFATAHPEFKLPDGWNLDQGTGTWTPETWDKIFSQANDYSYNQANGYTGAGGELVVPRMKGYTAPAVTGEARPIPQGDADIMNALFGVQTPRTARIAKTDVVPLNIAGQRVSAATLPGRIEPATATSPEFGAGSKKAEERAKALGIAGEHVLEVNPFKAQLKGYSDAPSFIEASQRLNLEHMADVNHAVANAPQLRANTLTQAAGFQPGGRQEVQLEGPDGKRYRATFDGFQDFSAIGQGRVPQYTALEDLPGATVARSTTYGPSLENAGYKVVSPTAETTPVSENPPKTFVVRHGSTEMNNADPDKDRIRGHIDVPLDEKGRQEAEDTGRQIAQQGGVAHIVSSDLGRTMETADAIAKHNPGATIDADPGLRPWKFGPTIEGQVTNDVLPKIRELTENPDQRPPGGETFNEFKSRFLDAFHRAQDAYPDSNSAIVTHYRGTKLLDAWRATGTDNDTVDKAVFEKYDKDKKPGNIDVIDKNGAEISTAAPSRTDFQPTAPNEDVRDAAADYAKGAKIPYIPHTGNQPINPSVSRRIADYYEAAKSNPQAPEVAAAYDAFKGETKAQWDSLQKRGYTMEPWQQQGQPYGTSQEMAADVRDNKHLWFFPTESGFGNAPGSNADHPLLEPSGVTVNKVPLSYNDLFRAVHDMFGHAKEGYEFGPRGELNAYLAHSKMYSPEAQPAMAAETLGQNSWVNFGSHLRDTEGNIPAKGEPGYIAPPDRPFAEQKAITLPSEITNFAPSSARKGKNDYKLKEGPGMFSKAWILPNGKPEQIGDQLHHDWLNQNEAIRKQYNIPKTDDIDDSRKAAIRQGFARVNYEKNTGTLKVEARSQDWNKLSPSVLEMVKQNLPKIDNMDVHLLDRGGNKIVESDGVQLHTYEPGEKLDHIPLITEKTAPTVSLSAQSASEREGTQFSPGGDFWLLKNGNTLDADDGHEETARRYVLPIGFKESEDPDSVYQEMFKRGHLRAVRGVDNIMVNGPMPWDKLPRVQRESLEKIAFEKNKAIAYQQEPASAPGRIVINQPRPEEGETFFQPSSEPRALRSAAVRDPDTGEVFEGTYHGAAIEKAADALPKYAAMTPEERYSALQHGFTTNDRDFLTRAEAEQRAEETGQMAPWAKATPASRPRSGIGIEHLTSEALKQMGRNIGAFQPGEFKLKPGDTGENPEDAGYGNYWLSPDGKFHRVGDHGEWALERTAYPDQKDLANRVKDMFGDARVTPGRVGRVAEEDLKNKNWIRLSRNRMDDEEGNELFVNGKSATPKQQAAMDLWREMNPDVRVTDSRGTFFKDRPSTDFQPPSPADTAGIKSRLDEFKDEASLAGALKKPGWAILTATQEARGPASNEVNQAANDNLEKALIAEGYNPQEVEGEYKGVDQGKNFLVMGMTPQEAKEWGDRYGQESTLTHRGLVWNDGSVTPADPRNTVVGKEAKDSGNWTRVKGGPAFSMGLNFGKKEPLNAPVTQQQELLSGAGGEANKPTLSTKEVSEMSAPDLRKHFPEAIVPKNADEKIGSDILNSPLAKAAGNEPAAVKAFASKLVDFAKQWQDHPAYQAGLKWYSEFTPQLKKVFGKDSPLMAELLAATSPQNAPEQNFAYALDALEQYKMGRFDKTLKKFGEGLDKLENGTWGKWLAKNKTSGPDTEANFLAHWIDKHDLSPTQSNGAKFGVSSGAVLKVLARRWLTDSTGPKTLNFVKNLLGTGNEATIDVWADRTMRRLGYEGMKDRWRILPKNATGVTDPDFYFSQKAFRAAADELGIEPSALQGALWFAEKAHWANNGWGKLDLGDFRKEISKTDLLKQGIQQRLAKQKAIAKARPAEQLGLMDIQPRSGT